MQEEGPGARDGRGMAEECGVGNDNESTRQGSHSGNVPGSGMGLFWA